MMRLLLAAGLVVAPALAGCIGGGETLIVVANAPRLANGMSIAVAVPRGLFGPAEGFASFIVSYQGRAVYPFGGVLGAPVFIQEGKGAAFVPYADFVVDNGDYVVAVEFQGREASARVPVEKWVNWVYVLSYVRNETLVADIVLETSSGSPGQRVFAAGQLDLEVRYRGEEGEANEMRLARVLRTDGRDDFVRVGIPLGDLERSGQRNRGFYSVEATFHNDEANGNKQVPMDPALANSTPPANWVYLELEEPCDRPVDVPPLCLP